MTVHNFWELGLCNLMAISEGDG